MAPRAWGGLLAFSLALAACTGGPAETKAARSQTIRTGGSPGPAAPGESIAPLPLGSGSPQTGSLISPLPSASASAGAVGASPSPAASASATPAATASATPAATSTPTPSPSPIPSGVAAVDTVAGIGTGQGTDFGAFADGAATSVGALSLPVDLALDPTAPAGTTRLFIADSGNRRVRLLTITASSATLSTYAGTGDNLPAEEQPTGLDNAVGTQAKFYNPFALSVAADGTLYVLDSTFNRTLIRKVAPTGTHAVTTLVRGPLAGGTNGVFTGDVVDGDANTATFFNPSAMVLDEANQRLYVADRQADRVRAVALSNGAVGPFVGSGVTGVANGYAEEVIDGFQVQKPQPTGPGAQARMDKPAGLALASGRLYTIESFNPRIRMADNLTATRTIRNATGPVIDWMPEIRAEPDATNAWNAGYVDGPAATAKFAPFNGTRMMATATQLFIADMGNQRIRLAPLNPDGSLASVKTIAGSHSVAADMGGGFAGAFADGPALNGAKFDRPGGMALAADGTLYVADQHNHRVRRIRPPATGF